MLGILERLNPLTHIQNTTTRIADDLDIRIDQKLDKVEQIRNDTIERVDQLLSMHTTQIEVRIKRLVTRFIWMTFVLIVVFLGGLYFVLRSALH